MNKSLSLIFFLFILIIPTHAQKKQVKAADEAFSEFKYATAIEHYRKAYSKVKNDKEEKNRINYQLAECYRLTNNIRRSEIQYKRLAKINYQEKEPSILLHLANALLSNKKAKEALVQFQAYQLLVPDDIRGKNGIESCTIAIDWKQSSDNYTITNLKKINSREDDFAPAYANNALNTLVFTSNRATATGSQKDEWTDKDFSDLFITRLDRKGNYSLPVLFDNEDGLLKSELHLNSGGNEGTPQLNSSFTNIYYTKCPADGSKNQGCKIYTSSRSGRNWSRPKPVKFENDTTHVIGHPSISGNELTIYFASERNGGFGGKDIWMAKRANKNEAFGRPQNLGSNVNTAGDEVFPFIRNDSTIYFSSNGHIGLGGLDIYRAVYNYGWNDVQNLKSPINSIADDFSIIFNPETEEGFFTSNRKGSRKDDLYSFYKPVIEYTLEGTLKNENTLQYLEDVEISLISSSGTKYTTLTNARGKYKFGEQQLRTGLNYEIIASKEDFLTLKQNISNNDLTSEKKVVRDFNLSPIPSEAVVLPDILYDLGKWELKAQYQDSLQGLIKTLDENKNLTIELAAHTDTRDTDERNDILSQRRARSVVEYLILRGIDPERLVAKGYGERQPRELKKNINKNGINFRLGTKLTEEYVNGLRTNAEKEAAHELNRRTEFRILNKDFEQKKSMAELNPDKVDIKLNVVNNEVAFTIDPKSGNIVTNCLLNDHSIQFAYNESFRTEISLREALRLLNNGDIDRNDFIGDAERALANGTIANQSHFNIKKLTFADKTIENTEVIVNSRLKNTFQFGNEVLSKFGKFAIDKEAKKFIFQ
jgi:peptidoglycan-associated lipoprotein